MHLGSKIEIAKCVWNGWHSIHNNTLEFVCFLFWQSFVHVHVAKRNDCCSWLTIICGCYGKVPKNVRVSLMKKNPNILQTKTTNNIIMKNEIQRKNRPKSECNTATAH